MLLEIAEGNATKGSGNRSARCAGVGDRGGALRRGNDGRLALGVRARLFADRRHVDAFVCADRQRSDFSFGSFVDYESVGGFIDAFPVGLLMRRTRPFGSVPAIRLPLPSKARTLMWASSLA